VIRRRLLLLDIDGTLLHTGGAGMRAFTSAVEQTLAAPVNLTAGHFAGKLDCIIFNAIMDSVKYDSRERPAAWETFKTHYLANLQKEANANGASWTVYPGVHEFIERHTDTSLLALLTGNIRKGARIKLTTVGLWDSFPCGAFGDRGNSREELAEHALEECGRHYGPDSFSEVWVIGDTVSDIMCGRRIKAKTIGVRTGFAKKGELESAGADMVVDTLEDVVL
jgi:phosphoglycolate phosphatase